ncbi:hypothetical protein [Litorilituus lipolyticus]|uniref:Uncharacterized protein n=1 Tax=Litorilituus lipolyticus TaxID=2491017 RepID=A0A502KWB7_9GAMM|nr:hypothetical protein [Litorilituus lipolyticus]TPH12497.1 hypothetical protein EPA86_16225 [Litorilituus lipolyticus]
MTTLKDYMQYKRRIIGAAVLGLVVIIIGTHFFALEEKNALYIDSTNIVTEERSITADKYSPLNDQLTLVHTETVLDNAIQIYAASEAYSQCEVENAEVWERLEVVKSAINDELNVIADNHLLRDAVFLLQSEGHFKTFEALFNLKRLQLAIEKQHFQRPPNRLTQEEIDLFTSAANLLRDVSDAATDYDIEQTIQATRIFRQNSSKRGFLFRRGKNKQLWTPDVLIGHTLATAPLSFVDSIAAQYPTSHLLFTQAVRSGASNEVLKKLLSSFDFTNTPIYTKHNNLQTALQAAIEIESLSAMRLILSQPNLQHTDFIFNPLNMIVFDTINRKVGEFTDTQKAMMALLVEHGFRVDIVSIPFTKKRMLAGYAAILERPIVDQLKALSIPPRHIEKLRIHPDSTLPLHLQDQLKHDAFQSQVLKNEYNERAKTCGELKQALQSLVPPLTRIDDIFSYVSAENSFVDNVHMLKQQSLTLVDAYYAKMERESADTQRVDAIAASTSSLQDIPFTVSAQINELTPFERHHLTEVYCEKFGKRFMEDIFDIVQYMSFSLFSFEACLAGTPDDYTETELNFYLHENTYPGIIYSKLERYTFDKVLEALADPAFQRPKDLQGYPHGRDALMLALDLKLAAHSVDKKDYKAVITDLIAKTSLKDEHFKRLHRLKVAHFLFFEEIASFHPQIRQAVEFPLATYRTHN